MDKSEKKLTKITYDDKKAVNQKRRFNIAFSFPGEYRDLVDKIANKIANIFPEERILYDWFHRAEFARPNLDIYLQNLYKNESELIVVFICAFYNKKKWCGIEWRAIRELLNSKEVDDKILFVKCGEGEVDGVFNTVDGYIDSTQVSVEDIVDDITSRYCSIYNKNNDNGICEIDDSFIQMFTPVQLFDIFFGKSSTPIFRTDSSICKNMSTFYKFVLPERIIEINPKIWNSSARRSNLFNERSEKKYIEKMYYSLRYEKQMDKLIENCQFFLDNNIVTINMILLQGLIDKIIYSISVYQDKEKQRQNQEHPGYYVGGSDFFFLKVYLEEISIKDKVTEIFAVLIAFSFLKEQMAGIIYHLEFSCKRVMEATAWMALPLYADNELLLSTYMALCDGRLDDVTIDKHINYHKISSELKNKLTENHCAVKLNLSNNLEDLDGSLLLTYDDFLLEDFYVEGQHLIDFQEDVFKLLDVDQSKAVFMFSFSDNNGLYIKMYASGSKFNIRMAHLLQVIYDSDRMFPLSVIGYLQKIRENHYTIKPIIIGYDRKRS